MRDAAMRVQRALRADPRSAAIVSMRARDIIAIATPLLQSLATTSAHILRPVPSSDYDTDDDTIDQDHFDAAFMMSIDLVRATNRVLRDPTICPDRKPFTFNIFLDHLV